MISAHPGLPEFDYIRPATLTEASQFLASHAGEARPFSGGTDSFVRMRDGFFTPKYLVDIKALEGTTVLRFDARTGLTIGAAVPMNRVAALPEAKKITRYWWKPSNLLPAINSATGRPLLAISAMLHPQEIPSARRWFITAC